MDLFDFIEDMSPKERMTLLSKMAMDEVIRNRELEKELDDLKDKLPKTSDGVPVVPGDEVHWRGDDGEVFSACVRKVCDGGEYGFTVEVSDADGPQGWVALRDCYSTWHIALAAKSGDK